MWVHFVGIAGKGMAALAAASVKAGYQVTGSDHQPYPPATDQLDRLGIKYFRQYQADHVSPEMDQVVIGGNAVWQGKVNPEIEQARALGIPVLVWPKFAYQLFHPQRSVVVTGSYGKTTVSSLLVQLLLGSGQQTSYLVGTAADLTDQYPPAAVGQSDLAVWEGDEHPTLAGWDDMPKISYYHATDVLLTGLVHDHFNIYPTWQDYQQVFADLLAGLSDQGWVLADAQNVDQSWLQQTTTAQIYTYGESSADWSLNLIKQMDGQGYVLGIRSPLQPEYQVTTKLWGEHNWRNLLAALAAAELLGLRSGQLQSVSPGLQLPARRLQLVGHKADTYLYQDMGQLPAKAKSAVQALRQRHPQAVLVIIWHAHASVLRHAKSLERYHGLFDQVDLVIVPKVKPLSADSRVTGKQVSQAISQANPSAKVLYLPKQTQIVAQVKQMAEQAGSNNQELVVAVFSSGQVDGLLKSISQQLGLDAS